ncbi:non-homologous end-joining DNA ligase [Paracoccus sp. PS-1]|uniref:non-homologous end-joining DNA ligase n=1 Tax=Paracoccus sp. PS1 TaxID=2963938 RepID=UPI0027E3FA90|nr:non-homologous end-joining DNA ligase [Paracoccus sp. PS1]MDQ7263764.1 non-homologous end-joining DNA ligase [Paracoccus sp. PS1]
MPERIEGVAISHPERVIFADAGPGKAGLTKAGLARYYQQVAPLMLQEAADRPLSMLRLPEGMAGERFFQKHPGKGFPKPVKQMQITESDGEAAPYAYVTDAAGLVAAVQMGTVEFHIWAARRDRLERPDRLVFDLDPDEGLGFAAVRAAALALRGRLRDLDLDPWAMLTGGKGVHLVLNLRRNLGWDELKHFARGFATLCARDEPDRYTVALSKASRKGRIFIDWLRNERGATAVAPFSVRARPGAPVAAPLGWDELTETETARAIDIDAALERGWAGIDRRPQTLTRPMVEALDKALAE